MWAGLAIAVIIGTPMLDGDLALPESLLIGPVTVGVVWFLCSCTGAALRRPRALTLVGIGVLLACGFLIQQTALADFGSIMLWCLVRRNWRTMLVVGGTFAVVVAAVVVPFVVSSGVHNVWFALVTSYADYLGDALGDRLSAYLFRIGLVVAMLVAAWCFRNAKDDRFELVRIWATALLFTAIAAGYSYEHFLLPVMIPMVMLGDRAASRDIAITSCNASGGRACSLPPPSSRRSHRPGGHCSRRGTDRRCGVLGYYVNAAAYATGAISVLEYDTYFGVTQLRRARGRAMDQQPQSRR